MKDTKKYDESRQLRKEGYLHKVRVELGSKARALSISSTSTKEENDGNDKYINLIEPPYAERHVRWCEGTATELISCLLLDYIWMIYK